jgi:hypothetical protein
MVSKHGARVHTGKHLVKSNEIFITIPNTGRKQKAKVVLAWEQAVGLYECAIELEHPENLWGVTFPPEDWAAKRATEEELHSQSLETPYPAKTRGSRE